ncbi:hypothetical protein GCM10009765_81740 [Fodinicola feengrottensis]|uniref:Protein kinase domain-containing protein n=1 Tax=Fodinicola feengrottensis TaxID=435914 RepID=A0ABN2JAB2_9ACTN
MEPLTGTDPAFIAGYETLGRLGAGGMGVVYLGRAPSGRLVAVKVIRARFAGDLEFRARFHREVAAARVVSGAFTAPVIDADPDADQPWLVTAYVAGLALDEAVRDFGPLPVQSVRTLAGGLAEALRSIHAVGLVHRDFKPSNMLLAADGPRVIDFGISRALDASKLTQTGFLVGSPGFMSPEQAAGQATGPASDVFSFGAVLAYAATGREPFGGDGPMPAQIYRTLYTEPDLTGLDTPWLREITLACLDKQAERRPTAQPLLDFLLVSAPPSPAGPWLPPAVMAALAQRVQQSEHLLEIHRLATEKAAAERRRRSRRAVIKGAAGVAVLAAVGTGSVVLIVENSIPPRSPEWSGLRVTTTPLSPPNPGGWNYTKEAQLAGPHGSVGISWSAVGDELDSHEAADLHTSAIRARPGQKLLVAAVDQMVTYAAFPPGKANPVVVKLKVGDQSTDLKNLPLSENSSTTQVIVVGAAPTTPIRLQLVDAGRMAEMDLRTAKVIDNPYQQFQSDAAWTGSATATAFFYGQPVTTEISASVGLSTSKQVASIVNYFPGNGWAPPGKAFLAVPAPVLYGSFLYPTEVQCDDSTAFSFHLPSGAVVPADRHARTTILLDTSGITPVPVTFLVPADTRGGRIVLDLSKSQLRDISSSGATTHRWQKAPTFALPLKFPS